MLKLLIRLFFGDLYLVQAFFKKEIPMDSFFFVDLKHLLDQLFGSPGNIRIDWELNRLVSDFITILHHALGVPRIPTVNNFV